MSKHNTMTPWLKTERYYSIYTRTFTAVGWKSGLTYLCRLGVEEWFCVPEDSKAIRLRFSTRQAPDSYRGVVVTHRRNGSRRRYPAIKSTEFKGFAFFLPRTLVTLLGKAGFKDGSVVYVSLEVK